MLKYLKKYVSEGDMDIREKLNLDREGLIEHGPITIVALGDSVTHGAFGPGEVDQDKVYHRLLAQRISKIRSYVPVNVINAGIGATNAKMAIPRLEKQVFTHNPDLVTVCFGLNDVNVSLEDFSDALRTIFGECIKRGIECIFLTPNMLNTYTHDDTHPDHVSYSKVTAKKQSEGVMDRCVETAKAVAEEMGVKVADAYAVWKERAKTEDTTLLLANRINHPIREMHEVFADVLMDAIFGDRVCGKRDNSSTMYDGK